MPPAAPLTQPARGKRLHAVAPSAGAVLGNALTRRKLEERDVALREKRSAEVLPSLPGPRCPQASARVARSPPMPCCNWAARTPRGRLCGMLRLIAESSCRELICWFLQSLLNPEAAASPSSP